MAKLCKVLHSLNSEQKYVTVSTMNYQKSLRTASYVQLCDNKTKYWVPFIVHVTEWLIF